METLADITHYWHLSLTVCRHSQYTSLHVVYSTDNHQTVNCSAYFLQFLCYHTFYSSSIAICFLHIGHFLDTLGVSTIMYLSPCISALYVVCTSYKCITRICQHLRRTIPGDILCILFTDDQDIVSVEIMTLHGHVLNYKFYADVAFASCSFKVLTFFRLHLFIDWPSFMMHDITFDTFKSLPRSIHIPFLDATTLSFTALLVTLVGICLRKSASSVNIDVHSSSLTSFTVPVKMCPGSWYRIRQHRPNNNNNNKRQFVRRRNMPWTTAVSAGISFSSFT